MQAAKNTLDFVVIGAQKAGTTSLFEYLKHHPEIFIPPGKEVFYFSHDAELARGWEDYVKKNFASADSSRKWGTVSPSYMIGGAYGAPGIPVDDRRYDERTVPLRIRERSPQARLIAILRDPVERAYSHYRMTAMNGLDNRSFDEAIEQLLTQDALVNSRTHPKEESCYVAWGEYGRILSGYLDVFPREQILILFTEELDRNPEHLLFRIYEFLDVESGFVPNNLGERYRVAGERRHAWLRVGEARRVIAQNQLARSLWKGLPDLLRHPIDRAYDRSVYAVDLWNRQAPKTLDEPSPTTQRRLREHFEQDALLLRKLLDVSAPWQTSVPTG